MKTAASVSIILVFVCLIPFSALSQQEDESSIMDKVKLQQGPTVADLGEIANIQVPQGYVFADAKDTRLLMEAMHNPTSGDELGFIAPEMSDWFLLFEFDEAGYIKDDEKASLDAESMLKAIRKGNEAANRERSKRGWTTLKVVGWQQAPRYNSVTHNLEWAIKGESEGNLVVNWNTRLLGRNGVMKVTLVTDPNILDETLPYYESLIAGFDYNSGHRYAEFRQGDKIAEYGLSALVVGGAAAVAAKSGILKYLWKGLVVAFIAAFGFLKKLFGRKQE